ncbi:MAG: Serine hydroxymethyltransferase [Parcubacteria group bacterium Licking1014_17]|nr:MAG: Serine hydroxymethyltransferase [Parcubacteria group bacterium Licking1014_17]
MIKDLIKKEEKRQKRVINLIASENYASAEVREAAGSVLINKYAEGKSHERYYFGNEIVDLMEDEVKSLALMAFKLLPEEWDVNVQPYSGSIANLAAYAGTVGIGGKILAMSLSHGGHLSHGHKVNLTSKIFEFSHYGVGGDGLINYDEVKTLAESFKPGLIVCGATSYPRIIDFKKFREIADGVDAPSASSGQAPSASSGQAPSASSGQASLGQVKLMVDMSHFAGLVAGEAYPSPFPFADVVTTTTQKTLRGPRGAMIFSKVGLSPAIDKAVFPGLQGGPHMNTIAAIGVALEEAMTSDFREYARQVVKNAKKLADELAKGGIKIVTGGTDSHLVLADLTPLGITGQEAGERLEAADIIVNKNMVPDDPNPPRNPSGIRLGTAAVTTQGMKEKDMVKIAAEIIEILKR